MKIVPTADFVLIVTKSYQYAVEILILGLYYNDAATNAYVPHGKITLKENREWWIGKGLKEAVIKI